MYSNLYTKFIKNLKGEFVIGFVLVFYFILPFFNIIRAFFKFKLTFLTIFIFFLFFCSFSVFFLINKKIYSKCLIFLFNDFLTKNRNFLSLGAFFIKNRPFSFAFFLIVSTISIFYCRDSNIFWMHAFYCICVCLRNIFIVPYLGYNLIITTHLRKKQLLRENNENIEDLPLFKNTKLSSNLVFYYNFVLWADCIATLKPPVSSLKKTSYISIPGFCLIYLNFFYQKIALFLFEHFENNKKCTHFYVSNILTAKDSNIEKISLIIEIANKIQIENEFLTGQMNREMDVSLKGFYFFFNQKKIKQIVEQSDQLFFDSMNLNSCCIDKMKTSISQENLLLLSEKYKNHLQISSILEFKNKCLEFTQQFLSFFS